MKRFLTLLLTLAMTLSLALPAQAANNTQATTMRLMETEGTATVENAIGKKLTIQDKMRLYNGYEVSTQKASYAYISLDNNKAVKLDASSSVTVNQSGKKLELDVTAGELFFNVPVALKSDESLKIRSSTMVTGIRGTAGWVNALDRYTTRIGVLEGAVTIQSLDPFTGADRSVTITGGQIATIIRHERANAIQQQLIDDGVIVEENIIANLTKPGQIVEELQEDNVPGFVATEVSKDQDLQNRINNESPLNADEITENIVYVTNTVTNTVTNRVEVSDPVLDTKNPPVTEIQEALDKKGAATVTDVSNLDLSQLSVGENDVLNIVSGSATVSSDTNIAGTVNVFADATLTNTGALTITSTNSIHIYGTLVNAEDGKIYVGYEDENNNIFSGALTIEKGGSLTNNGLIWIEDAASTFTIEENGTLTNNKTGSIDFIPKDLNFIVHGTFNDYANEVYSQDSNDAVTYLGNFDVIAADYDTYHGKTFKLLDAGELTVNNYIVCAADTELTLDLNGRSATVCGVIEPVIYQSLAEDGDETDESDGSLLDGNVLVFETDDDSWADIEDGEYYMNFTLIDSVGVGSLTGSLILDNWSSAVLESGTVNGFVAAIESGYFEMTGGTLAVPSYDDDDPVMEWLGFQQFEYCPGVSAYDYGGFYMDGGTIDATADNTWALAVLQQDCLLESGTLIGQQLLPNSIYGQLNFAEAYIPEYGHYGSFDFPSNYWICFSEYGSGFPSLLCCETDDPGIFRSNLVTLHFGGEE